MKIQELKNKFENFEDFVAFYDELIEEIQEKEDLNIFTEFNEEKVRDQVKALENTNKGSLYGIPVTIKDNISVKDALLSCSSKMLEDFKAVYDASLVEKLKEEGAIILGKVNMDEFACGSSSETSHFGMTKNPLDPERVPGGSSSGSAASVAANFSPVSIGTDTGGSCRQPASYCNVIGYTPSYGRISRYGVVPMAGSLDTVGILSKDMDSLINTFNVLNGEDEKDLTTLPGKIEVKKESLKMDNLKVGILTLEDFTMEEEVREDMKRAVSELEKLGVVVEEVEFDHLHLAGPAYSVICASEFYSSMSRFDGIRYGFSVEDYEDTEDLYRKTRTQGFGEEVKRRIALGAYYTDGREDQKYYQQAIRVRRRIQEELNKFFEEYDFLITPSANDLPYKFGERNEDPMMMYDSNTFNVPVNLAGLCALSLPIREGISGSLQIIGGREEDESLLQFGKAWEARSCQN